MKLKVYCNRPFTRIKIDEDGQYHSCCHQTVKYGNVFEEDLSIKDALRKQIALDVKSAVLNNKLHSSCNNHTCPFWSGREEPVDNVEEVELNVWPQSIEINLPTTHCNIGGLKPTPDTACQMCPRSHHDFDRVYNHPIRTKEIAEWIKPAIPHLNNLSILGIAEPFWKDQIFDVLDILEFKEQPHQPFVWTFTNGTIFTPRLQDRFIEYFRPESYGSALNFSMDAGTPETYKEIRRINAFSQMVKNIKSYTEKTKGTNNFTMASNNINLLNLHEMKEMIDVAREAGVPKVRFELTYVINGTKINKNLLCNKDNWEKFWEAQLEVQKYADEIGYDLEWYRPFHNGHLKNN